MRALRGAGLGMALTLGLVTAALAQGLGRRDRTPQTPPTQEGIIPKQDKIFPLGASWVAVSLNGRPFTGVERPSFTLDKQYRARGFGGCNNFSATAYPLREQSFAVGPLALTKKQCDKAVMEREQAFFVALRTAQKWDTETGILVLKTQSGDLRFERGI